MLYKHQIFNRKKYKHEVMHVLINLNWHHYASIARYKI